MADYALPMYDIYRDWIRKARQRGDGWTEILYAGKGSDSGLSSFLEIQRDINWWDISVADWKILVSMQERAENETKQREQAQQSGMIVDADQDNALSIPTDPMSSWQLYKQHLLANGFASDAVTSIEEKTLRLLHRLKRDNPIAGEAVKGLVVGNVQSGKTANMAALMAMAADWGWNVFIVLSGTIESLRQQTQSRMLSDLNCPGNIAWVGLEHLSPKTSLDQRTQYLSFENGAKQRYFTVCLKNPSRLKNLIDWLQSDAKKAKQMRILVIDDEADQAGVNSAKIDVGERRRINKLIINMVQGLTSSGKTAKEPYLSMNYIGYTATPYANILNESSRESLYPSSFISTLDVSNQYFGPQQIFGQEGNEGDGLDIVRVLPPEDLDVIMRAHEGFPAEIPQALQDSLTWFLCCAACFRVWGMRKPISMLVHTSQRTEHHQRIAEMIQQWFESHDATEIINMCSEVWEKETTRFDKTKLFAQYREYGRLPEQVCDYPDFQQLVPHLYTLAQDPKHIKLDDEQELSYHDGTHLCVDNSKNSKITDESDHIRLAYPTGENMPELAPAFIVVGGATLSRGLTLEGLVSTFFVRSVSQADSLMQMGRWFGYRKKCELLPRIWMTEKTRRQFVFLSTLDFDLRREIRDMEIQGKSPRQYAVKVNNSPQVSFIRLTAKNKMQSVVNAEFDYSGVMSQTTLFDDSIDIQNANIELTKRFVSLLPHPNKNLENKYAPLGLLWTDIPFDVIKREFLSKFKFQQRSRVFSDMTTLAEWISDMTAKGNLGNWNIRFASLKDAGTEFKTVYGPIGKVNRSQKTSTQIDGLIDIGVLRDPRDMVADIDVSNNPVLAARLESFKSSEIRAVRHEAGMDTTPLLVIYCIDQFSKARVHSGDTPALRKDLEAQTDLIGICICIPGGKPDGTYVTKVQVKLEDEVFDGSSEVEEIE